MIFARDNVYNIMFRKYPDSATLDVIAVFERSSDNCYFFRMVHKRICDLNGPSLKIYKRETQEFYIEYIGNLEDLPEYNL